jgi:hypothetical protein
MQQLLNLGEGEGLKKAQPKHGRAGRTRPYAVADVHEWRERNTGKIFRLTIGQMMQKEQCGYSTVKGWIDGVERRKAILPKSKASRSALLRGEQLRKYDWLQKLGRTVDGDFFAWLQSKPIRSGGAGLTAQHIGDRISPLYDHSVLIMAKYQSGIGTKRLIREYGGASNTMTALLREGGVDTSARANYKTSGECIRSQVRRRHQVRMKEPHHRLRVRVMNRIWSAMRAGKSNEHGSFALVGCTVTHLRTRIESLWAEGMNWDNYGKWHIDHIRPVTSFDLSDCSQAAECFNWKNLQPLWARDNLIKGGNYGEI